LICGASSSVTELRVISSALVDEDAGHVAEDAAEALDAEDLHDGGLNLPDRRVHALAPQRRPRLRGGGEQAEDQERARHRVLAMVV
jgi:hypothetical protein